MLEVGKTYQYNDWFFVVVREASTTDGVEVLALTDFTWTRRAGQIVVVHHQNAVSAIAQELA